MEAVDFNIHKFIEKLKTRGQFISAIEEPEWEWDRFNALRRLYAITDATKWDPYIVDWMRVFTPIERMVWGDLRTTGVNMWPQYPVDRFFLDFADPKLRIAIECDGKEWHDPEKDADRDMELGELGWTVFRLSGADCKRTIELDECADQEDSRSKHDSWRWMCLTSEGLVEAIAVHYHGRKGYRCTREDAIRVLESRASKMTPFNARSWTGTTAS